MKMQTILIVIVTLMASITFASDQDCACCAKKPGEKTMQMKHSMSKSDHEAHAMVKLPTIQCGMCKSTIESALSNSVGIISVDVDVEGKMAHINFDSEKTDQAKIEKTISLIGYQANQTLADAEAYKGLAACCKVSG